MNRIGLIIHQLSVKIYRVVVFPFRKLGLLMTKNVSFGIMGYADLATTFDGNNYIGQRAFVSNCRLGRGTYIGDGSRVCNINAGKFCSIGFNVTTAIGKHPTVENFATSPSMFSTNPANRLSFSDTQIYDDSTGPVNIGNDVWIGNGATLIGGVTIGDGAIVGAGSVVNKSLEAYGIYAGVPAKLIRMRFDNETINKLEQLKWWDKDDAWLKQHVKDFANTENVDGLIAD